MNSAQLEQLRQLMRAGPIRDRDAVSTRARDELIAAGLAHRVIVNGEPGYTAASNSGWHVFNCTTGSGQVQAEPPPTP